MNNSLTIRYNLKSQDSHLQSIINKRIESTGIEHNLSIAYQQFSDLFYFEVSPPEKILGQFFLDKKLKYDLFIMMKKDKCTIVYLFYLDNNLSRDEIESILQPILKDYSIDVKENLICNDTSCEFIGYIY